MGRWVGVNGIADTGSKTTDSVLSELQKSGLSTFDFNYPRISLLQASLKLSQPFYNRTRAKIAKSLFLATQDGDSVIAHSFGCAVVHYCAAELGRQFKNIILIAPALSKRDVSRFKALHCNSIHLIHNRHDWALNLATRFPLKLSNIGRYGSRSLGLQTKRFVNFIEMEKRFIKGSTTDPLNHSYAFDQANKMAITEIVKVLDDMGSLENGR